MRRTVRSFRSISETTESWAWRKRRMGKRMSGSLRNLSRACSNSPATAKNGGSDKFRMRIAVQGCPTSPVSVSISRKRPFSPIAIGSQYTSRLGLSRRRSQYGHLLPSGETRSVGSNSAEQGVLRGKTAGYLLATEISRRGTTPRLSGEAGAGIGTDLVDFRNHRGLNARLFSSKGKG